MSLISYARSGPFLLILYGIAEAGSNWTSICKDWLSESAELILVIEIDQLYLKDGDLNPTMTKVTYYLESNGKKGAIQSFYNNLKTGLGSRKTIVE